MIESLAEHGVQAEDLVPALMTTHSVKNPEYDPKAAKEAELERHKVEIQGGEGKSEEAPPPPYQPRSESIPTKSEAAPVTVEPTVADAGEAGVRTPTKSSSPLPTLPRPRSINPFGDDDDEEDGLPPPQRSSSTGPSASKSITSPIPKTKSINPFGSDDEDDTLPPMASSSRTSIPSQKASVSRLPSFDLDLDDDGDIGRPASPPRPIPGARNSTESISSSSNVEVKGQERQVNRDEEGDPDPDPGLDPERTPTSRSLRLPSSDGINADNHQEPSLSDKEKTEEEEEEGQEVAAPLPSLPGVSTTLTSADENVVLDIRWTVVSSPFLPT